MKRFLILATILFSFEYCEAQSLGLGNVYNMIQSTPKLSKEQRDLKKQIELSAKQNKNTLDENLQTLQQAGYFKNIFVQSVTNNNTKFLIAIDDSLYTLQKNLNDKILNLRNYSEMNNLVQAPQGDSYNIGSPYNYGFILRELKNRRSDLIKKYSTLISPLSTETNIQYLEEITNFSRSDDDKNLQILQDGLDKTKQLHDEKIRQIAENKKRLIEEKYRDSIGQIEAEKQYALTDSIEKRIEEKKKAEMASLPSRAFINTKFSIYKHKSGNTFYWFPVGYKPKSGKVVIDTYFGRKSVYREVDTNTGNNLMAIEYYRSGSIKEVNFYARLDDLRGFNYHAEYNNHALKPYQIMAYSADEKFSITHDIWYENGKELTRTSYKYEPTGYYYEYFNK